MVEVRSETDDLGELMEKMRDSISDGVALALLIDPRTHTAHVFASGRAEPEVVSDVFSDQTVLPQFSLDLTALWATYDGLFVENLAE